MDWSTHREEVETLLMLKVPLKTGDHIEKAIVHLNDVIIEAATRATSVISIIKLLPQLRILLNPKLNLKENKMAKDTIF